MSNIFQKIAAAAAIVGEVTKTIADAEQLVADISAIENDPNIKAAVANDPTLAASVARVSAEIRSGENDINALKDTLHTLLH